MVYFFGTCVQEPILFILVLFGALISAGVFVFSKDVPIYKRADSSLEERIKDLLSRMTIEEKVAQLHAAPMQFDFFDDNGFFSQEKAQRIFKNGICFVGRPSWQLSPSQAACLTNDIQKFLVEKTRLGIPALFHEEALHGFMAPGATMFPQAIALGSTWDPSLVKKMYQYAAKEIRARGSNYVCTPDLDLARDARWGRTEECFGEDPFLVSQMAKAAVEGLQGKEGFIDAEHVIATAKHFVAHGQPESGTNTAPIMLHERDLRQTFFPPFKAAIKAGVLSVMASYNEISGIPSHINSWLLQTVLVDEWGFKGFVTSDGWAVDQLESIHHVAENPEEAARKALEAGVDVEIEDGSCYSTLVQQFKDGLLDEKFINRAVERVLRVKFLLGLFENPYCDPEKVEHLTNCSEHQQLALDLARKSLILLKNENNLLPLNRSKIKKIAVIGPNAADLHLGGYSALPKHYNTILDGIKICAGSDIDVLYAEGCRITETVRDWRGHFEDDINCPNPEEDKIRIRQAIHIAKESDVVILAMGENESTCREAWSKKHLGDRDNLNLLGAQQELVEKIVKIGKPVVLVLVNGRPLTINWIIDNVPAILEVWYPGQEGGTAVAEALFGDINPGGKLTITWPRSVGQIPCFYNHKPSAHRGYLFADTSPLFPFGYGQSYSTFEYKNVRLLHSEIDPEGQSTLKVDVTNSGSRTGDEIVQLYIRDKVSSITRPIKELKGFKRITLAPGETQTVQFEICSEHLGFYNKDKRFVVEPGEFDLQIGGDCENVQHVNLVVKKSE